MRHALSKTDVTSYYEFVDHDLLCAELIAQTGEELAVDMLAELLASVLGRRVGLPQVHPASDILGDAYIDPARRRLQRRGYAVFTYSDDFRIASPSLGDARAALEACAIEVRALGLVLNERKTYTYGAGNYRDSLTSFADAEQRLFVDGGSPDPGDVLGFLDTDYGDEDGEVAAQLSLGASPLGGTVDEDEVFATDNGEAREDMDPQRLRAAQRAWRLWINEDESEETQAGQDAAITQSLVGRALPVLGAAGDISPLETLSGLLRFEPALTRRLPHTWTHMDGTTSVHARIFVMRSTMRSPATSSVRGRKCGSRTRLAVCAVRVVRTAMKSGSPGASPAATMASRPRLPRPWGELGEVMSTSWPLPSIGSARNGGAWHSGA